MSAPTKEYAIGDDRSDHADTPRPSSTEDESATLLRPRESFHLQDHQATKRSAHSRLVVVSLLLSNLMTIAVGVFLLSSDPRATYHDKEPKTVVYPPHPDWFPPQSMFCVCTPAPPPLLFLLWLDNKAAVKMVC